MRILSTFAAEVSAQTTRAWYRQWYGEEVPTAGDGALRGRGGAPGRRLEALGAAADFDREFIEQMAPHHGMGVMMARMVLARTDRPELRELARDIIEGQTAEIEQMREWYRAWYR